MENTNNIIMQDLLERDAFLECLQQAGVDNWEGYAHARELFREQYPEFCIDN